MSQRQAVLYPYVLNNQAVRAAGRPIHHRQLLACHTHNTTTDHPHPHSELRDNSEMSSRPAQEESDGKVSLSDSRLASPVFCFIVATVYSTKIEQQI